MYVAPTMKQRVSQRDLARLAGVSPMTVSLALRGHPSIPLETRQRISDLAHQHHYRPDPALAALNAYRVSSSKKQFQGVIGWLTYFPTRTGWREMIQMEGYYRGACAKAEQYGYQLEDFWMAEPGLTPTRATQILLARGVRGLIVAPLPKPHSVIHLDWRHFAVVTLGYSLAEPHLHVVMNHQSRNMKHTVHRLFQLGYRRIGLAMPSANDERVDHNYLGGYLVAQCELPPGTARLEPLLAPHFTSSVFRRWFGHERPDAVIASSGSAYQVKEWLKADGIAVPKQVGLAVAATPFGDTTLSGMNEDVHMVGGMTVDAVVGMIHRSEQGIPVRPWSLLTEGIWFPGKTVRRKASNPSLAAKKP